ncbi:hypothetical protein J2W37_003136 [Variovorax paradoxus]|uniref:Uncharacterized protein n=1 Tax=Variovorax paradoxus TaxID=34073 RepID=A0AAE3Y2J1_VARPD|nr:MULTISPECIES: hypothetical protein [Variovorax]MBD9667008.1 hypothetical protein [Variovorax sp. VRV01]MDP9965410.1 hypothetical protein [Variovorax paradoxus]MDR6428669.1 hypothetical protein [Variovorax paradoxus]MDR6456004.1 hypothetical protein [Variovorax paradoxus]
MSYYTRLDLSWDDGDYAVGSLAVEDFMAAAKECFEGFAWSTDVLEDLQIAAEGRGLDSAGFNQIGLGLVDLLQAISLKIPDVTFHARGIGEDVFDTWIRQFRAGQIMWQAGPFDSLEAIERPGLST